MLDNWLFLKNWLVWRMHHSAPGRRQMSSSVFGLGWWSSYVRAYEPLLFHCWVGFSGYGSSCVPGCRDYPIISFQLSHHRQVNQFYLHAVSLEDSLKSDPQTDATEIKTEEKIIYKAYRTKNSQLRSRALTQTTYTIVLTFFLGVNELRPQNCKCKFMYINEHYTL